MLCKCNRGGAGGSVGSCIGGGSDNPGVSDGVLMAVEEQVSKTFPYLNKIFDI